MPGSLPDGFPVTAPQLPRPVFTQQHWSDLTFVHWPVDPHAIEHLFPGGTRPDVFGDGLTYVGLVPFVMSELALGVRRPIPYFGHFLETNVRLYSTDDEGRHGVLFRSLETARLAVVPVTRTVLGTPYTWASMRLFRDGQRITYDNVRRLPQRGLRSRVAIEVGARVDPTPLEVWLTARWGAHTRKVGRTWWVPNQHAPFPFHEANVLELNDQLVAASGVTPMGERLRALYSPGVQTSFGRPTRL
ncbi:YqjF family protein [Mycolicibacterium hodleri]|uniref:DUF2071 domain-containing protein n=1 Tax=Mycolicibacterium hodleri TaxID=49897 RepID=A0A502DSB7_9MYCO|nr:DUF2071 domain-containing protein [Mycolicibacterium hodleri]TPG28268.1 hypothetical protein EAH80_27340 [Mycolicibacterium hodleri]